MFQDVDMSNIEESVNYHSNDNSSKPISDQSKSFTLLLSLFYTSGKLNFVVVVAFIQLSCK
ncbi:uncharacterized protein DC041_0004025 [Schistosoma bovis]|uniref:Uncharacterized protein n=1 Tax=Schistosoma bovis TaxID=6184 RepID=A0A430QGK9_SCHBO|nr:uncharacterized protein DC041_0001798 [Schistosoma bovis]RTG86823.1 uncharacterized protein DC041_0004025 [Schistosoma bovis]